jgi:hypothetical protein
MVGRPARRPDRTTAVNSGRRRRRACAGNTSGGELLAALATTAGEDGAARTGAHPQPEAVGLGPTTVVRLERALAHEGLPLGQRLRTTVLHPAGRRATGAGADGAALRTRKLVSADRPHRSARRPAGLLRGRQGPSTDALQHSRGPAAAGGRDDGGGHDRPARLADRSRWGHAGAPEDDRASRVRRAGVGHRVVARLWMRLLASPSLRVGHQGSGARADPVGRPTAVRPSSVLERAADLRRCRSVSPPGATVGTSGRR